MPFISYLLHVDCFFLSEPCFQARKVVFFLFGGDVMDECPSNSVLLYRLRLREICVNYFKNVHLWCCVAKKMWMPCLNI